MKNKFGKARIISPLVFPCPSNAIMGTWVSDGSFEMATDSLPAVKSSALLPLQGMWGCLGNAPKANRGGSLLLLFFHLRKQILVESQLFGSHSPANATLLILHQALVRDLNFALQISVEWECINSQIGTQKGKEAQPVSPMSRLV